MTEMREHSASQSRRKKKTNRIVQHGQEILQRNFLPEIISNLRKVEKRMKKEARWENTGRDRLSLQDMMEMYEDGYEFVVQAGHVVAVLVDL